jgi:ubiquinone/menaquinone biosynthesis C-methylase UbiE
MHLVSIEKRLNNPRVSKLELGMRQAFCAIIKERNFKNAEALSVSCGEGVWDYLVLKEKAVISKIIATDIVDCPVLGRDIDMLNSLGAWRFVKVAPDAELPFEGEEFDLVYHLDVIEHTEKPFFFLKEQHRVLRQGGTVIVGTPNLLRPANILKALTGKLKFPNKIGYREEIGDYIHVQEFHEAQLMLMLKECGFKNIKAHYVYFGLSVTNVCFSMLPSGQLGKTFAHFLIFSAEK